MNADTPSSTVNWRRLLLYLFPLVLGSLPLLRFSTGGVLFLSLVTVLITAFVRREILAVIQRLERAALLEPAWAVHRLIPGPVRKVMGIGSALILSFLVVEVTEMGGFQGMVLATVVATPVAYFFFRRPL